MRKSTLKTYLNKKTDVYHLVDQSFVSKFEEKQGAFMLMIYYEFYCSYCKKHNVEFQPIDKFLLNASKKKVKIIQVCCPYCGRIEILIEQKKMSEINQMQYCTKCGKKSTAEYIFLHLSSLIRMQVVHNAGFETLSKDHDKKTMEIFEYDIMQTEIVELTCILEKILRDFYMDISHIVYRTNQVEYIERLIEKNTNNDFMHFDKANNHYKKGLNINLQDKVSTECKKNLIDLVNIRNIIIHNNGFIDERFKKTETFSRVSHMIKGDLIFIKDVDVDKYVGSVSEILIAIEEEFDRCFKKQMNMLIANYYFNKK